MKASVIGVMDLAATTNGEESVFWNYHVTSNEVKSGTLAYNILPLRLVRMSVDLTFL